MSAEGRFWVSVWAIFAVFMLGLSALMVVNAHDRRLKWAEAVSNGADPMVTSCALYEQTSAEIIICSQLAQNRK